MKKREPLKENQKIKFIGWARQGIGRVGVWFKEPTIAVMLSDENTDESMSISVGDRGDSYIIHRRQVTHLIRKKVKNPILTSEGRLADAWDKIVVPSVGLAHAHYSSAFQDFVMRLRKKSV